MRVLRLVAGLLASATLVTVTTSCTAPSQPEHKLASCHVSDLSVLRATSGSVGEGRKWTIIIANRGAQACILLNRPVAEVIDAKLAPIGAPSRAAAQNATIRVNHAGQVRVEVTVIDPSALRPPCPSTAGAGMRIFPVSSPDALTVDIPSIKGCANPGTTLLNVAPIRDNG